MSNPAAVEGLIAFLRSEARQAEERARSLRTTAAALEAQVSQAGRKKKRKHSSVAKNRNEAQSAFSLFVQENFELLKKDHADMPRREIMSILDRQWESTSEEEKQIWRYRAEQSRKEHFPTMPGLLDLEGLPEEENGATNERGSGTDLVTKRISV